MVCWVVLVSGWLRLACWPLIPPLLRGGFVLSFSFHGLRDAFGIASPVATGLRPFGAGRDGGVKSVYCHCQLRAADGKFGVVVWGGVGGFGVGVVRRIEVHGHLRR